jgi:uncharacterized protein YkwD
MVKTTLFLILIAIIVTFTGCQPLTSYKDKATDYIDNLLESTNKDTIITTNTTASTTPETSTTPTKKSTYKDKLNLSNISEQELRDNPELQKTIEAKKAEEAKRIVYEDNELERIEKQTFDLINQERIKAGLEPTIWDNKLYNLSKAHTQDMANQGQLFHSPMNGLIGEDAWGVSWGGISRQDLAGEIVNSWMSSPLHSAWILHIPLKTSVVSIVDDNRGQYASWTFWTAEAGEGPPLIQRAYNLWQSETGGNIPWLTWLYDVKGYPDNQDFLKQLGIK